MRLLLIALITFATCFALHDVVATQGDTHQTVMVCQVIDQSIYHVVPAQEFVRPEDTGLASALVVTQAPCLCYGNNYLSCNSGNYQIAADVRIDKKFDPGQC